MLHMTIDSILTNTKYDPGFEIIVVDDGSTDGSCDVYRQMENSKVKVVRTPHIGVSRARNAGFEQASGRYVVFLDAHCKVDPLWLVRFQNCLQDEQVGVAGPTFTRLDLLEPKGCGMMWTSDFAMDTTWYFPNKADFAYDIPLTPGGCQAFQAKNFKRIGRYDEGFARWGSEDLEICLRSWVLGYRNVVDPNIIVQHYFRETRNFEVREDDVLYNFLRLVSLHFNNQRKAKIIKMLGYDDTMKKAIERVEASDIAQIRFELDIARQYDDDWFFSAFGCG